MRSLLSTVALSLAAAGAEPASAAPPAEAARIAPAFGNTIKALYPDGRAQRLWFKADGTWEAIGRRGKWSAGKWSLKDDKVCLKQSKPFPAPFKYCTAFPAKGAPGVVWASRDMNGEPIRLTLIKGIERP